MQLTSSEKRRREEEILQQFEFDEKIAKFSIFSKRRSQDVMANDNKFMI